MRRTIICGLFVMLAATAAWGAKFAVGQTAGQPQPGVAGGQREETVVQTTAPDGAPRQERFVTAPDRANPSAGAGYVRQQAYVPVQIEAVEIDEEFTQIGRREAELAQRSQSLVKKLAETEGDAERTPIVNELEETIGKQFDIQQQMREVEVSRIEAKVKKLRDTITKRGNARAAIVRNRREQLLQESEGLGWNSPDAGPAGGWGGYPPGLDVRPRLPAARAVQNPHSP